MTTETLHATCVAIDGKGVLILGESGTGKSALALQLMALGACLVADDRTMLTRVDSRLMASVPGSIAGLIEARGVGLIKVPTAGPTRLGLVVDLNTVETQRLPEPHSHVILGLRLPCLQRVEAPHFASAILHHAKGNLTPS